MSRGSALSRTLDCAGRDVVVRGDRNQLALVGRCRSVEVQGNTSYIRAELAPGARVSLRGDTLDFPDGRDNPEGRALNRRVEFLLER